MSNPPICWISSGVISSPLPSLTAASIVRWSPETISVQMLMVITPSLMSLAAEISTSIPQRNALPSSFAALIAGTMPKATESADATNA